MTREERAVNDEDDLDFMTRYLRGSIQRKDVFAFGTPKQQRLAQVCWPAYRDSCDDVRCYAGSLDGDYSDDSKESDDDHRMDELHISSPFPNTWKIWWQYGPNVAICMSRDGRYLYWPTTLEPEDDLAVSRISLNEVPELECFDPEAGFGKKYSCELEDIYEGAWVMKGDYLETSDCDDALPSGVLDRLRGGFFRSEDATFLLDPMELYSRLKNLARSVAVMSPTSRAALGFRCTEEDGVYDCNLAGVAELIDVNVEVLAAHISEPGLAYEIFQGLVGYAGREFIGPLRISEPTPIGEWMVGRLLDTGTGLLYNESSKTYHAIRNVGDVSYLEVCTKGIVERRKLVLGKKLHGDSKAWDSLRPVEYFKWMGPDDIRDDD